MILTKAPMPSRETGGGIARGHRAP